MSAMEMLNVTECVVCNTTRYVLHPELISAQSSRVPPPRRCGTSVQERTIFCCGGLEGRQGREDKVEAAACINVDNYVDNDT